MKRKDILWKETELVKKYLDEMREAVPFAKAQLDIMLRLIDASEQSIHNFLDIGCGDGVLGNAVLEHFPDARGIFLDFSEPMLQSAYQRIGNIYDNIGFVNSDYSDNRWVVELQEYCPFDVIISGYSIHHQPNQRKKSLYAEIYSLLNSGGIFINVEHVASNSKWGEGIFDNYFIDSLCSLNIRKGMNRTREEIANEYYHRSAKEANILAPVVEQCEWLREIGFHDVDCYFKVFELAVFGGRKID